MGKRPAFFAQRLVNVSLLCSKELSSAKKTMTSLMNLMMSSMMRMKKNMNIFMGACAENWVEYTLSWLIFLGGRGGG